MVIHSLTFTYAAPPKHLFPVPHERVLQSPWPQPPRPPPPSAPACRKPHPAPEVAAARRPHRCGRRLPKHLAESSKRERTSL